MRVRIVIAILLFILAFLGIGIGVAQRTVLLGPPNVTLSATTDGTAPITVIDGSTLTSHPGTQTLSASGSGPVFLAYGRSIDVMGWVGQASYNEIGYDPASKQLTVTQHSGTETTVPSPDGSDLWIQQYSATDTLTRSISAPSDYAAILLSDGTQPAPSMVSLQWPLDTTTPWSGPLIFGGSIALLLGLLAFVWALVHARRGHGPRRKSGKAPKTPKFPKPPQPPKLKRSQAKAALPEPQRGRRKLSASFVVTGVAIALTGCTAFGPSAPTPGSTDTDGGDQSGIHVQVPAVTPAQFDRILQSALQTVSDADKAKDPDLAATRLTGPALEYRTAAYKIKKASSSLPGVPALPTEADVKVMLPQQSDVWPRTVFAVVGGSDPTSAPVALMLAQASPRDNYKIEYNMTLEPNTTVPDLAPQEVGAVRLPADNKLGVLAPDELAADYGDILIKGDASAFNAQFQADGDTLRTAVGSDYKKKKAQQLPATAKITFSNGPGPGEDIAFGTIDTGQIVAVDLNDVETVAPREAGSAVGTEGAVKALSGKSTTMKGIVATYGLQLLFYVPPAADTTKQVQLLGFTQGLVAAQEVKKK